MKKHGFVWLHAAANKRQLETSVRHILRLNPNNKTALNLIERYRLFDETR